MDSRDVDRWAEREKLTPETLRVLKEEGFDSLEELSQLTSADIDTYFTHTNLMKKQQCMRLKQAVERLNTQSSQGQVRDSGHVASSAGQQRGSWQSEDVRGHTKDSKQVLPSREKWVTEVVSEDKDTISFHEARNRFETVQGDHQSRKTTLGAHTVRTHMHVEEDSKDHSDNVCRTESLKEQKKPEDKPTERSKYSVQEYKFSFSEELRFLLVGKTGVGKSTTGNTILGDNNFRTSVGFSSETSQCEICRGVVNGLNVQITDSPGLFDTSVKQENIAEKIAQAVACLHPGPHAFLFVVKIGRFTQEEEGTYKRLIAIFDKDVTKYMVVVFTGGDNLRSAGKTINDIISTAPDGLQDILIACGGRYVVFDNMAADKLSQINSLFQIVLTMVNENIKKRYTCPQYMSIGEKMEEEIQKRMMEVEKREIEHKEYIKQLEMKNKVLEEEAKKAKDELEMRKIQCQKELKEQEEIMLRKIQEMTEKVEQKLLTEKEMKKQKKRLLKEKEDRENQLQTKLEEDRKKMEEDEKKRQKKAEKAMEEMKKSLEKMERARQEEINKLKDSIARNEERGLLGRMADGIADTASAVYGTIRGWLPF